MPDEIKIDAQISASAPQEVREQISGITDSSSATVAILCAIIINGAVLAPYSALESSYNYFGNPPPVMESAPIFSSIVNTDVTVFSGNDIMKRKDNLAKISRFEELAFDWGGNGERAFNAELLNKLRTIVPLLARQPSMYPTADATVQLEYYDDRADSIDEKYLEFEVYEDITQVYMVDRYGNERNATIKTEVDQMNKVVNDFYGADNFAGRKTI